MPADVTTTTTALPVSQRGDSRPRAKWREAAVAGWQPLPDVLLKNQAALGLSAIDMVVLVNLLSYWWYLEQKPFPRPRLIAKRMNVSPRTVQRCLQKLIDRGLIQRRTDVGPDGTARDVFDPEGLVSRLEKLALSDPAYAYKLQRMAPDGPAQIPS